MKPRRLQSATILSMVTTSVAIERRIVECRAAMPIYEYRRPDGTTFEVMQKFSDDALTTDPETGEPVERVLPAAGHPLQGLGLPQHRLRDAQAQPREGGELGLLVLVLDRRRLVEVELLVGESDSSSSSSTELVDSSSSD